MGQPETWASPMFPVTQTFGGSVKCCSDLFNPGPHTSFFGYVQTEQIDPMLFRHEY